MDAPKKRCRWVTESEIYRHYHDNEWGVPVRDSRRLFACLMLEGQQAGLSWLSILKRRDTYYSVYAQFCPEAISCFDERRVAEILLNPV